MYPVARNTSQPAEVSELQNFLGAIRDIYEDVNWFSFIEEGKIMTTMSSLIWNFSAISMQI